MQRIGVQRRARPASSMILPRYMTATRRGDVLDDGEIVGDEEVREPELVLQVLQQIDDLRLHGDVERGDRLVEHEELRIRRQRARDADALPLPAGELVRIALAVVGTAARLSRAAAPTRSSRSRDAHARRE